MLNKIVNATADFLLGTPPVRSDMDHRAPQPFQRRERRPSLSQGSDRGRLSSDRFPPQSPHTRSRSRVHRGMEASRDLVPTPAATAKHTSPLHHDGSSPRSMGDHAIPRQHVGTPEVNTSSRRNDIHDSRDSARTKDDEATSALARNDLVQGQVQQRIQATPPADHSEKDLASFESVDRAVVSVEGPRLHSPRSISAIESPQVAFTTPSDTSHEVRLKIEVGQLQQELDNQRDAVFRQTEEIEQLLSKAKEADDDLHKYWSQRNAARDRNQVLNNRLVTLSEQLQSSQQQETHLSAELQRYSSHIRAQEEQIRSLVMERDEAIAKRLSMDDFDSSVDRVSEGDLVSKVRSVNAAIDELVLAIQDDLAPFLPPHPSEKVVVNSDASLLRLFTHTRPGDDNWGLLTEALLHHLIVTWLQREVFASSVTPALTKESESLEVAYKRITATESWRASQRWRSITASATSDIPNVAAQKAQIPNQRGSLVQYLALISGASVSALQSLTNKIERGLSDIFENAYQLSLAVKRDVVSVQVHVIVGSEPALEQDARETRWAEMGEKSGDRFLGHYAFGLVKIAEHQATGVVLLRPQVVTEALTRYVRRHGDAGAISG